jgi:hypothetical protein
LISEAIREYEVDYYRFTLSTGELQAGEPIEEDQLFQRPKQSDEGNVMK